LRPVAFVVAQLGECQGIALPEDQRIGRPRSCSHLRRPSFCDALAEDVVNQHDIQEALAVGFVVEGLLGFDLHGGMEAELIEGMK
jgi:hypothetical protein